MLTRLACLAGLLVAVALPAAADDPPPSNRTRDQLFADIAPIIRKHCAGIVQSGVKLAMSEAAPEFKIPAAQGVAWVVCGVVDRDRNVEATFRLVHAGWAWDGLIRFLPRQPGASSPAPSLAADGLRYEIRSTEAISLGRLVEQMSAPASASREPVSYSKVMETLNQGAPGAAAWDDATGAPTPAQEEIYATLRRGLPMVQTLAPIIGTAPDGQ